MAVLPLSCKVYADRQCWDARFGGPEDICPDGGCYFRHMSNAAAEIRLGEVARERIDVLLAAAQALLADVLPNVSERDWPTALRVLANELEASHGSTH